MNLTSYLANKCIEYILKYDSQQESKDSSALQLHKLDNRPSPTISIHPPWSVDPQKFRTLCNGCGDCASACENGIIFMNREGYPEVDFSKGSCSFCSGCALNCPTGALQLDQEGSSWGIRAFITENCLMNKSVLCRTCVEQCDRKAIVLPKPTQNQQPPEILLTECNGCGACYGTCPAGAIAFKDNELQEKS